MPFKPAQQTKCPKCNKSVYAAEERAVGELKFHKECYKCSMCAKMLDSTNVNCHETVLFCKTCHGRKFGPKGYGFGGGAAGLSMDTGSHLDYGRDDTIKEYKAPKAAPGEGCPRCGGKVFAAEEMLAKGKVYHRTCFNCKTCRKPLDSVLHCDGPDKEVYCKVCYGKKFGPKGYGFGHGGGTLTSLDPEASPLVRAFGNTDVIIKPEEGEEACPRCGGKVFNAEMMMAKGRPFHKRCFKCKACTRPLDSMVHCDGPDGEIYCRLCYAKKYGPKGYGFAGGSGGVLTAENIPGGEQFNEINPASTVLDVSLIKAEPGEGCPRCGGKVFMAEEMLARGRSWHRKCYSCCHCHRPLDSMVGCDAPDGEVYCKLCYAKRYGPKGYGFSSGAGGVLSAENIGGGEDDVMRRQQSAFSSLDVSKIKAREGEGCPRCGGKVFMAEEVHARGRSWHRSCYSCCHCHRPLDSVVGCDAPDGEVYCKLCYAKKYGPKGYGFCAGAGGVLTAENIPGGMENPEINPASVAIDTKSILAAPGEGCPRCGGKVFSAEEMLSRNNKWHKRCYNCCDCHRPLDSVVLCDGPDGEIYCKLCYAKKFGPKGYGFASGAGGVLFPESITGDGDDMPLVVGNAPSYVTQLDIKNMAPAKEGQARCPRCGGAVFQAESMTARNKEWHKQCFNCVVCHRPLDSMIGCDAPDGEIYCKLCYAKRHGPKGYGYGHTATLVSLGTEDGSPIPPDIRQFGFDPKGIKQFLEGTISVPINGVDQEGERTQRTQAQKTVVNQIKNLPFAGRVPRGVDEADKEKLPWLSEKEEQMSSREKGSSGFKGFPSKKMTKVWKEVLPEEQETTFERDRKIFTTGTVTRQVKETSSSVQTISTVQESKSSHHISMKEDVRNMHTEEEEEEETDEVFENEEDEYEENGELLVAPQYAKPNALRPSSVTSDEEDAEVPTSDYTTQTSIIPPKGSQPQENVAVTSVEELSSDNYEETQMSAEMQSKMKTLQLEMQQQFHLQQQQVAEADELAEMREQVITKSESHSMEHSSETEMTMHTDIHESEVSSKMVAAHEISETKFQAVSDEVESSAQMENPAEFDDSQMAHEDPIFSDEE